MLKPLARLFSSRLGGTGLLGVLGVAIGVANIICLVSVTESGRWQAMGVLRDAGADTLFITPFVEGGPDNEGGGPSMSLLRGEQLEAVAATPEVDAYTGVLMLPGHVGAGGERSFGIVQGTDPAYLIVRGHAVAQGRFFTQAEIEAHANVCVLGSELAQMLFDQADAVGQQVVIRGQRFEVLGVMIEKGMLGFENMDTRVFIPLTAAQDLFEVQGVHTILARAAPGVSAEQARDALEARLREQAGLKTGDPAEFSVSTIDDLTGIVDEVTKVFRYMLYGVSSVALIVAGIGIMNVMLMQVIERTREIGVRRAVGARRRDIWRQFLVEATSQALIGALLGLGLGLIGTFAFCHFVAWRPQVTWETIATAVGFSFATGALFGLYPAVYAARLKPVDCLRYE